MNTERFRLPLHAQKFYNQAIQKPSALCHQPRAVTYKARSHG